ncbi:serpin family protein [Catellatospora vulcania]|uniref:serpin family protein n=1 Tax=Catellatospora vulcania TaxID=1460450 RepID=UPI0012D461AB|nr:serpin family protein [Catellatospora vulcania]
MSTAHARPTATTATSSPAADDAVASAVSQANALTARWAATVTGGTATALSGAGLWPLLAYLSWAAAGQGREELAAAVGLDADHAVRAANALVGVLDGQAAVRAAVGCWTRPDVPVREQWRHALPAESVGVLTEGAVDAWVRARTGGLLDGLAVPTDPETLLVLATALTVRTSWTQPFEDTILAADTGPWAKRPLAGLKRSGPDRDQVAVYAAEPGPISVLSVAGDNGVYVDLVMGLPEAPPGEVLSAGITAPGTLAARTGSQLRDADAAPGVTLGHSHRTDEPLLFAYVPRFDVAACHDLLASAELFGLRTVADRSRQRLPGISDLPLAVGAARQELTASFTADGFEAAVATPVSMAGGGGPPLRARNIVFRADRPFGFVARHQATGLVLLAGWVAELERYRPHPSQLVDLTDLLRNPRTGPRPQP